MTTQFKKQADDILRKELGDIIDNGTIEIRNDCDDYVAFNFRINGVPWYCLSHNENGRAKFYGFRLETCCSIKEVRKTFNFGRRWEMLHKKVINLFNTNKKENKKP